MTLLAQYSFSLMWPPIVALIIAVVGAAYIVLIGPRSGKRFGGAATGGETAYFFTGLFLYWVAWGTPFHLIGEVYLMGAHMVTMLLATTFAPPMLLLGLPQSVVDWALGFPVVKRVFGFLTKPVLTLALFNLLFFLWHTPSLYDRAIASDPVHYVQYATLILVGLLFWWPVVTRSKVLPQMRPLAVMGYTFATIVMQTVLFGPIMILEEPLYKTYLHVPSLIGLSTLEDQQLGHLLMEVTSPLMLLVWFSKAVTRLIRESGAPTRASAPDQ
ncbi:MAG TPA: cytochrome c oxidase assembly protein [Symbiobacteriaceae bacterium]|nr:cytochrome c oxidase assembly protein [Symbiobacteriaceae bacterium]